MLFSPVGVGFIEGRRPIPHHIIQRAKQMEKEQIIEAATWGYISRSGEQYYNETYGKSETER